MWHIKRRRNEVKWSERQKIVVSAREWSGCEVGGWILKGRNTTCKSSSSWWTEIINMRALSSVKCFSEAQWGWGLRLTDRVVCVVGVSIAATPEPSTFTSLHTLTTLHIGSAWLGMDTGNPLHVKCNFLHWYSGAPSNSAVGVWIFCSFPLALLLTFLLLFLVGRWLACFWEYRTFRWDSFGTQELIKKWSSDQFGESDSGSSMLRLY